MLETKQLVPYKIQLQGDNVQSYFPSETSCRKIYVTVNHTNVPYALTLLNFEMIHRYNIDPTVLIYQLHGLKEEYLFHYAKLKIA